MHKTKEAQENALIRYMYTLGFVNCYMGLFYAMFSHDLQGMNFILVTILVWKQLIINLIDWCKPCCKKQASLNRVDKYFRKVEKF